MQELSCLRIRKETTVSDFVKSMLCVHENDEYAFGCIYEKIFIPLLRNKNVKAKIALKNLKLYEFFDVSRKYIWF